MGFSLWLLFFASFSKISVLGETRGPSMWNLPGRKDETKTCGNPGGLHFHSQYPLITLELGLN